MSKEVLFAGVLAVACLVLVAFAFLAPHKPKPATSETVKTETTETVSPETSETPPVASATTTGGTATAPLVASTTGGSSGFTSATGTTTGGYTAGGYTTGGYTTGGTTAGAATTGPGGFTAGATTAPGGVTAGKTTGASAFTAGSATGAGSFTAGATTAGSTTGGTTQPPAALTQTEKVHVVAANETLAEISQKYYNTTKYWKKIAEANNADPNTLRVGQKLVIPPLAATDTTAATPPTVAVGPGERAYTIQKNDSYYSIAQKELGSASRWKEIQKLNGIGPEELHVGQVIKLPSKESAPAPTTTPGGAEPPAGAKVHVVASGETLSDIAAKELGSSSRWKELLKANPGVDPDALRVGQKLVIPEGGPAPKTSTGPAAASGDYVVQPGDNLAKIAEKELGDKNAWRKIADANPGVDSHHLRVGQTLKIPGKGAARPAPAPAPTGGGTTSTFGGGAFGTTTGGTTTTGGYTSGGYTTGGTTTGGGAGHVGPP